MTPGARRGALAAGAALSAGLLLVGCGSDDGGGSAAGSSGAPKLRVAGGFVPQPVSGDMAAGFFVVTNSGGGSDRLTSVTSSISSDVTLHSTKNGTMREQDSFAVPAHGALDFERGGNHVMFEKLTRKPRQGEKVSVTLHFATSSAVKAELPVKETTYQPPRAGHHQ